jgi:hypothetical protein
VYVDYYFRVEQGQALYASAEEEALYQFSVVVVRDGGLDPLTRVRISVGCS